MAQIDALEVDLKIGSILDCQEERENERHRDQPRNLKDSQQAPPAQNSNGEHGHQESTNESADLLDLGVFRGDLLLELPLSPDLGFLRRIFVRRQLELANGFLNLGFHVGKSGNDLRNLLN